MLSETQPGEITVNATTFETLLYESESETLDFKRDQYPFARASDGAKAELLKDILAFANAWRRSDAYILIGVEEVRGERARVVGVTDHPDDAQLQQFVSSKTNRPVDFSYEVYVHDGAQVGVLTIRLQERPLFLLKDYAGLKQNTVYIRRRSSTDIADPTEIARMGASALSPPIAVLDVSLVAAGSQQLLGFETTVTVKALAIIPRRDLPEPESDYHRVRFINDDYYVELVEYVRATSLLHPLHLAVTNRSKVSADDVVLEVFSDGREFLVDREQFPERPRYEGIVAVHDEFLKRRTPPDTSVESLEGRWKLSARFGRVHPGATIVTKDAFYVGGLMSDVLEWKGTLYGHNIEPVRVPLRIVLAVQERKMTMADLQWYIAEDTRS